jgi:hypothetical protein
LRFAHNQQITARLLRYQSKPRFARNQCRAARVIKGALRAAISYTSKYFFRASRAINIFRALRG